MQIPDTGRQVALYHTYHQLSGTEQQLLKWLAVQMIPFSENYILYHFHDITLSRIQCSDTVRRLQQQKVIVRSNADYGDYRIDPMFHLYLLLEIAKSKEETTKLLNQFYSEEDREDFVPLFFAFIRKGERAGFDESRFAADEVVAEMLPWFLYFEELLPLFVNFSPERKIRYWNLYLHRQLIALRPVNWEWYEANIPAQAGSDEKSRFVRFVLSGSRREWPAATRISPAGLSAAAFLMQLAGNDTEAIALYDDALKMANKNRERKFALPADPLFGFSYGAALLRSPSDRNRKKIQSLLKRKELKEDNLLFPTYLLLAAATGDPLTRDINRTAVYRISCPLTALLYGWVCANYELSPVEHEYIDESFVLVKAPEFTLLREITALYYPDITQSNTNKRASVISPLPVFRRLAPWETILQKLLEDPALTPKPEKLRDTEKKSRIIYLLTRNHEVIPVLQRSKEGNEWQNGRKIGLKTFQEGIPEMNETDKAVALTVRRYRAQWGNGYEYMLGGETTLAALAGYPLVFLYRNSDIPVEIVRQQPYLSVTRCADVFRIQTNVSDADTGSLIQINEESDTRINVLQLSEMQLNIIRQLTRLNEYPAESEPMLKDLLGRLSGTITIHSDLIATGVHTEQQEGDTTPVVQILPLGENFKAELFVKPLGDYPPYCKPGIGNRSVMGMIDRKPVQAIRNFRKEAADQQPVRTIFRELDADATDTLTLESISDCLELLDQLHQQGDSVRIEWPEGEKMKLRQSVSSSSFSILAKKNNTWFEIDGALRISKNEELQILDLMKRVTESETRFIHLQGNEYLAITEQLRRQLIELNSAAYLQKGKLLLSEMAAPLLDGFEKGGIEVHTDTHYRALLGRIREAAQKQYKVPGSLQATLREYQEEGFSWMMRLADWGAGACLADDMGLGKTIQSIAVLLAKAQQGASLVVAPASVLANWESELHRFAPAFRILNLNMPGADRTRMIEEASEFDVVITTYGLLIGEAEKLGAKQWNVVVLDEAHTIKNRETKMSKAAMKLQAGFRLILTGTPLQNHLSEIWNLFEFINPGLLGSFLSFSGRFIMPIELRQDKMQQRMLKKLLSPFILRRTKNEVLNELPGKTEILLPVDLSKEELTLYETMRRQAEMSLKQKDLNAVKTLAEITRLRQAACHPALVRPGYDGKASKTALFLELINELRENNHRALVFSQFTSHLAIIRAELEKMNVEYLYLDGATPTAQRAKLVRDFQTGSQPVFLISLKAGGLGLNLTAADFIIHLDPWWNPAVEDQASDRAYRIGQTRPVTVYRLIARHTIEEKIIELHHTKKDLADSLLEGSNIAHTLSREEMLALICNG